jgi:hypothetical protein
MGGSGCGLYEHIMEFSWESVSSVSVWTCCVTPYVEVGVRAAGIPVYYS